MARRIPFLGTTHRLKVVVTLLAGVVVLFASHEVLLPPNLVAVAVLTTPVPAQAVVPASDVTWMRVNTPPTTILAQTQASLLNSLVLSQALPAGSTIPVADLVAATSTTQLSSNEVPWNVTVSGALATYYTLSGHVSLWAPATPGGAPSEIAAGVRVIALDNSQGQPVTPTAGVAATTPSSVTLAVPSADLTTLLALTSVTVEPDSTQTHFMLWTGSGGSAGATLFPTGTTGSTSTPSTGSRGSSTPSPAPASPHTGTGSSATTGASVLPSRGASSQKGR